MGNRIFLVGRSINFSLSLASVIGGIYTNKFSLGYFNWCETKTVPVWNERLHYERLMLIVIITVLESRFILDILLG